MSDQKIYEYQSDWFQSFQEFLEKKKINREDKFRIKVNIIESNQTLEELGKRFKNEIEVIKSKEDFFYTIKIKKKKGFEKYLYILFILSVSKVISFSISPYSGVL